MDHENPIETLSEFMERVIRMVITDLMGIFNETPRIEMDNLRPALDDSKQN